MAQHVSPLTENQIRAIFGSFHYTDVARPKGDIKIAADWVHDNIVSCVLPKADGAGGDLHKQCHRLAKEPFEWAFAEIAARELWQQVTYFDDIWVPRHKRHNPNLGLSNHSWGTAVDINDDFDKGVNVPYNPHQDPSTVSQANVILNEVFTKYGFSWGNQWQGDYRDPMHWELADLDAYRQQPNFRDSYALVVGQKEIAEMPTLNSRALCPIRLWAETFKLKFAVDPQTRAITLMEKPFTKLLRVIGNITYAQLVDLAGASSQNFTVDNKRRVVTI